MTGVVFDYFSRVRESACLTIRLNVFQTVLKFCRLRNHDADCISEPQLGRIFMFRLEL